MPARRFRFEVFDDEGNRLQVIFEGRVSREKILQLIDLLELFGGVSPHPQFASSEALGDKMKRVFAVVRRRFPVGSFSSTDVKLAYEEMFGEPIDLVWCRRIWLGLLREDFWRDLAVPLAGCIAYDAWRELLSWRRSY